MIINTPVDRGNEIEVVKNTLGYTASKNLLENTATTITKYGVTFTVNEDGSVTVNGTPSQTTSLTIRENFTLPNGEYILSGCPEGGSTSTYYLRLNANGTSNTDTGNGKNFTINNNTISYVAIYTPAGQTYDNLTFYPMIRKASVTDDTYEPYGKSDVDTRLNDVDTRLNSIFNWKLVGSVTGNNPIALPDNWRELKIFAHYTLNSSNSIDFSHDVISKNILDELKGTNDTLKLYMGNGSSYSVDYDGQSLKNWKNGSSSMGSSLTLKVYCR